MVDDVLTSKLKVEKIKSNLGMAFNNILELHFADLMASISFYKLEKVSTLTSNVYLGYFKALLPDLNRAMILVTKDKFC